MPISPASARLRLLGPALGLAASLLATPLALSAQPKPSLTPADLGQWESLGTPRLSPDGQWLRYTISRGDETNELRVRGGAADTTFVIPFGTSPEFSADSRWIAYLVGVSVSERERLVKEKKPVRNAFVARNLITGRTIELPSIASFSFNPSGGFLSVSTYPAEGKRTTDVQVIDLSTDARLMFTNVSDHAWSERASLLALAITVDGATGNAVQLLDGSKGTVRVLESGESVYRALSWRDAANDLAVLRSAVDSTFVDTAFVVRSWTELGTTRPLSRTLETTGAGTVDAPMRVADYRIPEWSRDGRTLFVGLQPRQPKPPRTANGGTSREKVSDVEIWHSDDVRVITEQRSSESRDLRRTLIAAWPLDASRVVLLSRDAYETTTLLEGDAVALETDASAYAFGQKFGRPDEDVWSIDVSSGERTRLLTKARYVFDAAPSATWLPYFDGADYWIANVRTSARVNLTESLRTTQQIDFVNRDDDHPVDVLPPIGSPLWSRDGRSLLVHDAFNVWALALDGSGGRRLTDGAPDQVVHRVVTFADFRAPARERTVDLAKPIYLSLFGKRSKQSGYARRMPNGAVESLVLADASISGLSKADSTDRYVFVRQSFSESPNAFVGGATLRDATARTNTNAFQANYAWGKAELIDYTSTIDVPLQAILYYPANYDPSRKYPMIVYTYERLSQGLHRYIVPRETDYYNANVFTQNGYFVMMPDIIFRPREPGIAVLQSVEPAVEHVITRGLVDPANIGHAGHSQGGYEAYYLATHSKLFKTAVAGAGISDMISFAGQMHWNSVPEFSHWETGQFRMEVPPWEDMDAMMRNSPLNKVHEMPAQSILIEIGGEDPTVDMRQGVLFWNYARRAGKDAVMLLYPGEGHGLGKRENAHDYERRILQWFAYYLKGETPAPWITDGQSWIERKAVLDANKP